MFEPINTYDITVELSSKINRNGGALVSTGSVDAWGACLGWSLGPVKRRPNIIANNDFAPAMAA